jgi:transposase
VDRTPAQERAEQASLAKHAPKLTQYAEIRRRHAAGAAVKHIAAAVGVSRPTVYRYLRLDGPPERKRPHRTRQLLTPYEPYLRQRWEAGCRTKSQLVRDVRAQGYAYSTSTVYRFLLRLERNPAPPGAGSPPPMTEDPASPDEVSRGPVVSGRGLDLRHR